MIIFISWKKVKFNFVFSSRLELWKIRLTSSWCPSANSARPSDRQNLLGRLFRTGYPVPIANLFFPARPTTTETRLTSLGCPSWASSSTRCWVSCPQSTIRCPTWPEVRPEVRRRCCTRYSGTRTFLRWPKLTWQFVGEKNFKNYFFYRFLKRHIYGDVRL